MSTLNLGILAHVDAGKTSLTERLLYAAGVIDQIGSVDDGNTQTDSLALERQRGITIKSAVVSFVIGDVTVNLIDTPGHPDFIAEVERVLSVLDGAVLVISAVEGVQAQTRVLLRTVRRLKIPTLIFINKIDRSGARPDAVLRSIAEKLSAAVVAMGSATGLGTRSVACVPFTDGDATFTTRLVDLLAEHDDTLLAAYVADAATLSHDHLIHELAAQTRRAQVLPVFLGSAITGAGIDSLMTGITGLLPAAGSDTEGQVSGTVFKIERGQAGEKIAYVRMFSGTLRVRDRLEFGRGTEAKITAINVFDRGTSVQRASVCAGQIGKLWGLSDVRIADAVGLAQQAPVDRRAFAPPTLETVIVPARPSDKGALHAVLAQLAEQDPLINLRQDDLRQELFVSLYGEVQKEVIEATLANDFGIDVTFRETTTICIERPVGAGSALEVIATPSNPFLATLGLRVEPASLDTGIEYRMKTELGSLPMAFHHAIEETVHETLQQGIHGWQVTDCTVTLTHSGYWARQSSAHGGFNKSMSSTAGDFRNLTPLLLMEALQQAGTTVYEPMHHFHLELPADTFGPILPVLARLRAVPQTPVMKGSTCVLEGEIPAARLHELQHQLPSLSRGEGVLECWFDRHEPVTGVIPRRPRSDHNPLNRKEYLLHVVRRV